MTKEGSNKIVNFMTRGAEVLTCMLRRDHIIIILNMHFLLLLNKPRGLRSGLERSHLKRKVGFSNPSRYRPKS